VHADIRPLVESDLDEAFKSKLSAEQRSRLENALDGEYKAYPIVQGSYQVVSFGDEETESYFTRHSRHSESHCGCLDYFYRCSQDDTKFSKCKHLWRVWLEMYAGLVPPETEPPYEWLEAKVENEILSIIDTKDTESDPVKKELSQLKALRSYLQTTDRPNIDLKKSYDTWAMYKGVSLSYHREKQ
jgi:hypothetical protein